MGNIRNIKQSVGDRQIVKTAPDIVVYLEGLPYLQNAYLTTNASNPYLVNFNDHMTSFNANYDVDQMVPSGTFTLVVPAHQRYLYQAPGGINLIKTMMQVQVFCKGYYFANDGNTLFYRVFKGFTTHVSHTDDGKTLTISVQCSGILGFFELMQIDQNPAVMSSSSSGVTPLKSILANMSPYAQLAFTFLFPSFTDGFYVASIQAPTIQDTAYFAAINSGYVAKWQTILADICQEAHIYGLQTKDVKDALPYLHSIAEASTMKGQRSWSFLASQEAQYSTVKESDASSIVFDVDKIRQFMPDLGIGSVQLLNGRVTTRLELLRVLTQVINYECFQDIDGQIIIKPPLYNLDVTNLGSDTESDANSQYQDSHKNTNFTSSTNPFVVHLAEILNEMETEDQAAVRATRMVVQGNTTTSAQFIQLDSIMRAIGEFIDLPKLAQFGLREEPAHTVPWLRDNDFAATFAQAASELARKNKGFRTYSFTIPLRPEIHLGFPMYIPHRDMYGYTKSVAINFQIGGTATMSITLDALRKRPMFPQAQTLNGTPSTIFVAQPNLILQWSKGTQSVNSNSTTSPAALAGTPQSLPIPSTAPVPTKDQLALLAFQQQAVGSYFALSSDTTVSSWRIQADTEHVWSADNPSSASGFFRAVDKDFYTDIRTTVPYTDEKGYELMTPYPWGRWVDIKTALQEFTRDGYVVQPENQTSDFKLVQGVETFVYAGLGTPTGAGAASSGLQQALSDLQNSLGVPPNTGNLAPGANVPTTQDPATGTIHVTTSESAGTLQNITVFELDYSNFSPGGASSIIQVAQPSSTIDSALLTGSSASEQQKVDMFLTGTPPTPDPTFTAQVKAVSNIQPQASQPLSIP